MKRPTAIAACLLASAASLPASTASYRVLLAGNSAGVQTTEVRTDGERRVSFRYNDRGRGPELTARIRLDARGVPTSIATDGHDYLKGPVSERFSLEKGRASWRNPAENGERTLGESAFYVSSQAVPEEAGLLARALWKAPGHRLPLLPEGEARIERVGKSVLRAGGKTRSVVLYSVSGLDFTSTPIWLDRDGAFFASASAWLTVVREGWEPALPILLEAQDAAQDRSVASSPGKPRAVRIAPSSSAEPISSIRRPRRAGPIRPWSSRVTGSPRSEPTERFPCPRTPR